MKDNNVIQNEFSAESTDAEALHEKESGMQSESVDTMSSKRHDYQPENVFALTCTNRIQLTKRVSLPFSCTPKQILLIDQSLEQVYKKILLPNILLNKAHSIILTKDLRMYEPLFSSMCNHGCNVHTLDLTASYSGISYNPLSHCRNYNDLFELVNAILPEDNSIERRKSADLLLSLCSFLSTECIKKDRNLSNVKVLLEASEKSYRNKRETPILDILMEDLTEKETNNYCVDRYKNCFRDVYSEEMHSRITSYLSSAMSQLLQPDVLAMTQRDDISLSSRNSNSALFVHLPAEIRDGSLAALFFRQLEQIISLYVGSNYYDSLLILDGVFLKPNGDVASDHFVRLSRLCKMTMLVCRDLSQMNMHYAADTDSLLGCFDIMAYLGGNDPYTLHALSQRSNRSIQQIQLHTRKKYLIIKKQGKSLFSRPINEGPVYKEFNVPQFNNAARSQSTAALPFSSASYPKRCMPNYTADTPDTRDPEPDFGERYDFDPDATDISISEPDTFESSASVQPSDISSDEVFDSIDLMESYEGEPVQDVSRSFSASEQEVWQVGMSYSDDVIAHILKEDDDVILELVGKDSTMDFSSYNHAPWHSKYSSSITKVIVGDGITSIGNCLFQNLTSLRTVILGKNVERLGAYAFANCYLLENVTFKPAPQSYNYFLSASYLGWPTKKGCVGEYCFFNCRKLKEIKLPDVFKHMGQNSFSGCHSLESITASRYVNFYDESAYNHPVLNDCSSLKEINTFSMDEFVKALDPLIIAFLEKQKIIFAKQDISIFLNNGCVPRSPQAFWRDGNTYLFNPLNKLEETERNFKTAVSFFIYGYFKEHYPEIVELMEKQYFDERFELYKTSLNGRRGQSALSLEEANKCFADCISMFKYYFFKFKPFKSLIFASSSTDNLTFQGILSSCFSIIYVELHIDEILSVYRDLIGDASARKLSYSAVSKALAQTLDIKISAQAVRGLGEFLQKHGYLNIERRGSSGPFVYSFPATPDASQEK